jgi:hypothetical protein
LIKDSIKKSFPLFFSRIKQSYYLFIKILTGKSQSEVVFGRIYKSNLWNNPDSVSGYGSNLANTEEIRKLLPVLIKDLKAETFLDIPCGDFFWMKEVDLPDVIYTGADIVKDLVDLNNQKYKNEKRSFVYLDITRDDLPESGIIFCRDCLPHLDFGSIFSALEKIRRSGSEYLITSTYINTRVNRDSPLGRFKPINFQLPPFNFPKPLKMIKDKCIQDNFILEDKSLGLWKIIDLK